MTNEISANSVTPSVDYSPSVIHSNSNNLEKYAQDFLITLKMTIGIRYVSVHRLTLKDRLDTIMIAILSFSVIISSLIEWHLRTHGISDDWLSLLIIVSSIFILVISQYEAAKKYLVRAERTFNSATDISDLHNRLALLLASGNPLSDLLLKQFQNEYHEILKKNSMYHEHVDYLRFKTLHPRSYPTRYNTDTFKKGFYVHFWGRVVYGLNICLWPVLLTAPTISLTIYVVYKYLLKLPGGF